jgi:hypothetical protein
MKFEITDDYISRALERSFNDNAYISLAEGRLMLLELMVKAYKYKNSHTEEAYLGCFKVLNKNRTINAKGRKFLLDMRYKHSNNKSLFVSLSNEYRQ